MTKPISNADLTKLRELLDLAKRLGAVFSKASMDWSNQTTCSIPQIGSIDLNQIESLIVRLDCVEAVLPLLINTVRSGLCVTHYDDTQSWIQCGYCGEEEESHSSDCAGIAALAAAEKLTKS